MSVSLTIFNLLTIAKTPLANVPPHLFFQLADLLPLGFITCLMLLISQNMFVSYQERELFRCQEPGLTYI